MDLDESGWPQLPTVGSKIEFNGGGAVLQAAGVCKVVRADHVCNAAGKPGGRITLQTDRGELFQVNLSHLRSHANLISDGLHELEMEAAIRSACEHG